MAGNVDIMVKAVGGIRMGGRVSENGQSPRTQGRIICNDGVKESYQKKRFIRSIRKVGDGFMSVIGGRG